MCAAAHFAMAIERLDGGGVDAIAYVATQAAAGHNLIHPFTFALAAAKLAVLGARFFDIVANRKLAR
jgi:hypothetical protein